MSGAHDRITTVNAHRRPSWACCFADGACSRCSNVGTDLVGEPVGAWTDRFGWWWPRCTLVCGASWMGIDPTQPDDAATMVACRLLVRMPGHRQRKLAALVRVVHARGVVPVGRVDPHRTVVGARIAGFKQAHGCVFLGVWTDGAVLLRVHVLAGTIKLDVPC